MSSIPPSASGDAAAGIAPSASHGSSRVVATGVLLGVVSALAYTGTNIALRGVTRNGDPDWAMWVTCFKSLPGALVAWLLVGLRYAQGRRALPSRSEIAGLLAVGFAVQFGGNLLFQWSLAMCGLALAVPTVFATLILTGAVLGQTWLGEAVTVRSSIAMGLLIGAIAMLGLGAEGAAARLPPGPDTIAPVLWVLAGITLAGLAGVFYGTLGVIIRRSTRRNVPLPATLALISTTGVVGLGTAAIVRMGPAVLHATTAEWSLMILAGTLNAAAFFAISGSLQRIPVVQVNLLNASQAAMCALGGVLVYHEPLTVGLVGGTLLTLIGLGLMDRGNRG